VVAGVVKGAKSLHSMLLSRLLFALLGAVDPRSLLEMEPGFGLCDNVDHYKLLLVLLPG